MSLINMTPKFSYAPAALDLLSRDGVSVTGRTNAGETQTLLSLWSDMGRAGDNANAPICRDRPPKWPSHPAVGTRTDALIGTIHTMPIVPPILTSS